MLTLINSSVLAEMDEIRGAGKVARKTYSYMVTETQGTRNDEVRRLRKHCCDIKYD